MQKKDLLKEAFPQDFFILMKALKCILNGIEKEFFFKGYLNIL